MSKVRRGSKTETVEHSEAERQVKKQERYAARLLSLFRLNICSSLWFWPLKDSQPVKICELNVSSDRYKSLDWPAGSTLDMQATVLHESSGPSAFCLSRFTTVERKRTCLVTRAEDCIETANDDEDDDDDDDDDDDKERIKQVFSENISQCETSKDFGAKEAMRKKLTRFARNYKKHRRPKLKDTGAATESVRKSCFNKSTPSLEKRVNELEKELEEKKSTIKNVVAFYNEKLRKIEAENVNLKTELSETQLELLQTQEELGRVNFEKDRLINLEKHNVAFKQIFNLRTEERMFSPDSRQSSCSFSDEGRVAPVEDSPSTDEEPTVNEGASCSNVNASSVQESRVESRDRAGVSLTNIPTTAVERSIYNNYKLLLLAISRLLLASDVSLLKQWAISEFSIQPVSDASEMFTALDRKRIITAVNLDQLRDFFEIIGRIDVVYLIECFLHGDYTYLRNSGVTGFHNISYKNGSTRSITTNYSNYQNSVRIDRNGTVVPLSSANGAQIPTKRTIGHGVSKHGPAHTLKCSAGLPVGCNKWPSLVGNCGAESSQQTAVSPAAGGLVVTDGHGPSNTDTQREAVRGTIQSYSSGSSGNGGKRRYSGLKGGSRGTRVDSGSNGQKLSKFERPTTTSNGRPSREEPGDDLGDDEEWLCNHYKRRCYVKFDCCNKYWPCHRCHNNQTKCGQTKLKSRDTKFVKCVRCGKEQQFGANGQYCIQCNAKFSNYFCAICKHLTGKDDHPYHCDKCGICRIHGDRSFHCVVCGVCLDVQLRGNHKCRAGSAHDECCICLEDAFTGCQILPCSHKVHKECATQMIRSGITRCPICRESFAHKLERRTQSAKKPTGKN